MVISSPKIKLNPRESKAFNTEYQAPSDGFVFGYSRRSSGTATMTAKLSDDDVTYTIVEKTESEYSLTSFPIYFQVKKGEYWIVEQAGTMADSVLFWSPLK